LHHRADTAVHTVQRKSRGSVARNPCGWRRGGHAEQGRDVPHSKRFATSDAGPPFAKRMECGGKRSATPLWHGQPLALMDVPVGETPTRRDFALPAYSKGFARAAVGQFWHPSRVRPFPAEDRGYRRAQPPAAIFHPSGMNPAGERQLEMGKHSNKHRTTGHTPTHRAPGQALAAVIYRGKTGETFHAVMVPPSFSTRPLLALFLPPGGQVRPAGGVLEPRQAFRATAARDWRYRGAVDLRSGAV
jgi:hypothetical protein